MKRPLTVPISYLPKKNKKKKKKRLTNQDHNVLPIFLFDLFFKCAI